MNLLEAERAKYTSVWTDIEDYRDISPGMESVQRFLDVLSPRRGESLIDIGCGEGIAGLDFAAHGLQVSYIDITDAGLRPEVPRNAFVQAALWDNWNVNKYGFDYGYCVDVMEHLPREFTMLAAARIIAACRTTWFQIAFLPDAHGKTIGQQLHLTVEPFRWWVERLRLLGNVVDARDICGRGIFIVQK